MNPFDEKAADWDQEPKRVKTSHEFVETLTAAVPLNETMRALEFGCGTGIAAMLLAERVESIVAVDTSEGMLDVLREKIHAAATSNIEVKQIDLLRECPFTKPFDLIYSNLVFHHIADYEGVLALFYSMLSPGGIAAIADLDAEDGSFHSSETIFEHRGFEREVFKAAAGRAGFTDLQTRTALKVTRDREGQIREYPVFLFTGRKM